MSKTTLVVTAVPNPDEMPSVQQYLSGVAPLFAAAGGELVKRAKHDRSIHGHPAGMVLVMDFDTEQAAIDDVCLGRRTGVALLGPAAHRFLGMEVLLIIVAAAYGIAGLL